ncbi:MAG TPA: hypothetical protein HPP94_03590 [Desulfuromonadales bacterium]|nr:hypothetical protein [Desulfuromonadales bacterium]
MATTAERQRAYRSRRNDGDGVRRIDTWVSDEAFRALKRLAHHEGVSRKEIIQRLILDVDAGILKRLEIDSLEWAVYMNVTG